MHAPPAGPARDDWRALARPTDRPPRFDPGDVGHLPVPVQRWLRHAIAPGTPLLGSVELATHGVIRVGAWMRFTARQVLAPPYGFVWAATARPPGLLSVLRISGYDRYSHGCGEMRWRLLGLPVVGAAGPDVSRSAAGRLAAELMLVPAAALSPAVQWRDGDAERATAWVDVDGWQHRVTVTVDEVGVLRSVTLPRWGNPDRGAFGEHLFAAVFDDEAVWGGYTIPRACRAGWWWGSERWDDGEFIRFVVDDAVFR